MAKQDMLLAGAGAISVIALCLLPPWLQIASNGTGDNICEYHFRGFAPWSSTMPILHFGNEDQTLKIIEVQPSLLLLGVELLLVVAVLMAIRAMLKNSDQTSKPSSETPN